MTIFLSNLRFITPLGGWLPDYCHNVVQALVYSSNSVLKFSSSILAHSSVLENVALSDRFIQTPPSILIISIPISILKPNSGPSTTRTSAFMGLTLSTASVIVPMLTPRRISPLTVRMFNVCRLHGLHTDLVMSDQEHPEFSSAMCFSPLTTASIMGSPSFNLIVERVALTSRPLFLFPGQFFTRCRFFFSEITTHGWSFSPVSNTTALGLVVSFHCYLTFWWGMRVSLGLIAIVWMLEICCLGCILGWVFFGGGVVDVQFLLVWCWEFFFGSDSTWVGGLVVRLIKLSLSNSISALSSFIRIIISWWVIPWFWVGMLVHLTTFAYVVVTMKF